MFYLRLLGTPAVATPSGDLLAGRASRSTCFGGPSEDAVLSAGDELRLNPERIESDVAAFQAAVLRGDLERAVERWPKLTSPRAFQHRPNTLPSGASVV